MIGEQALFIGIIEQAFKDASIKKHSINRFGEVVETRHAFSVDSAIDFLTSNTRGFRDICGLAGLEPEWVITKYSQILNGKVSQIYSRGV